MTIPQRRELYRLCAPLFYQVKASLRLKISCTRSCRCSYDEMKCDFRRKIKIADIQRQHLTVLASVVFSNKEKREIIRVESCLRRRYMRCKSMQRLVSGCWGTSIADSQTWDQYKNKISTIQIGNPGLSIF